MVVWDAHEMDLAMLYRRFARPELGKMLELLKLDAVYERAEGDRLWRTTPEGPREVFDFLGGYGSTILGHHHPEIVALAEQALGARVPIHAQASVRGETALLARDLNHFLKEKTGDPRTFNVTLANSGAEAVEAALKHAHLEWKTKREELVMRLKSWRIKDRLGGAANAAAVDARLRELEAMTPTLFALEKGFHGKTAAAVSVTANPVYREMYAGHLFTTHFVSDQLDANEVAKLIAADDWVLTVDGREFARFSRSLGFLYEPIQGEGGIREISPAFLKAMEKELHARGVPLIADEIQSGLYRTGEFLASTAAGLRPDYILLGKSLGGSLAKISALLVADDHAQDRFGVLHTSTFAEDDFSSAIARKALEILNRDELDIRDRAARFEKNVRDIVTKIQTRYPGVLRRVRGRGFFLGLEFQIEENDPHPSVLWGFHEQGHATALFSSYLLNEHGLRVAAALSATETIRLEPCAKITDEALRRLEIGLSELCGLIHDRKLLALMSHLWDQTFTPKQLEIVSEPRKPMVPAPELRHVGFVTHMMNADEVRRMDKCFENVDLSEIERFLGDYSTQAAPFRFHQQKIRGANEKEIVLDLIGLMLPSSWFETQNRAGGVGAKKIVQDTVDLAASYDLKAFGLGQFTSIVSENGLALSSPATMPLTTGNSLTAGMAVRALKQVLAERGLKLADARVGIVGFTGNICHVISQILGDEAGAMTLLHREAFDGSRKFRDAVEHFLANSKIERENVRTGHQPGDLKDCDVVLVGTNSTQAFLRAEHLKPGAVVLDISVPSNAHPDVRDREDGACFIGGLTNLPFDQTIDHPWYFLRGTANVYACLAETLTMGLLGLDKGLSLGRLTKEGVLESLRCADEAGITLGGIRTK